MGIKKHVDTSAMMEEFLKKNTVKTCPDYQEGFDKPLNSTIKYDGNYTFKGGSVPGINSRNYDPNAEKEHITGKCRACKKESKFYVVDSRKLVTNRKRYSTLCSDCSTLPSGVVTVMASFKNLEAYESFIGRHGKYGCYTKYTLKELKELKVEAQNHSTSHLKAIEKVIHEKRYAESKKDMGVNTDSNTNVLGYEFDF